MKSGTPYNSMDRVLAEQAASDGMIQSQERCVEFDKGIQSLGFKDFDDFKKTKASMSQEEFGKLLSDLRVMRGPSTEVSNG